MSRDESFLARWSRRKRRAARTHAPRKPEEQDARTAPKALPTPAPRAEAKPPFDAACLPPLDSIDAASDIRAFLAAGVPAELTRAALRRAWSADPTIRDFIGLSENSWDFTAADGVPGFGPMTPDDVRKVLAQFVREPEPEVRAAPAPSAEQTAEDRDAAAAAETHDEASNCSDLDVTTEHAASEILPRSGHGGALPK